MLPRLLALQLKIVLPRLLLLVLFLLSSANTNTTVTATATGGTSPYTFTMSGAVGTVVGSNTISGSYPSAGVQTVYVSDSAGQRTSCNVTINQIQQPTTLSCSANPNGFG